jgi:hypothetical protein
MLLQYHGTQKGVHPQRDLQRIYCGKPVYNSANIDTRANVFYVLGVANHLVDVASRRFDWNDSQLVGYLNRVAPHKQSWRLVTLPEAIRSKLISALLKKRPGKLSAYSVPQLNNRSGTNVGSRFMPVSDSTTHTSAQLATKFRFSKSLPSESGTVDTPIVVNRSTLTPHEMNFTGFEGVHALRLTDSRLTEQGSIDSRLKNLFRGIKNTDPAAFRVKPMPIQVLHHAQSLTSPQDEAQQFILDAAYIEFFYMLRPGEYVLAENSTAEVQTNLCHEPTTTSAVFVDNRPY